MKKLLGWIVVLVVAFCVFQYGKAVMIGIGFDSFLQEQADRLVFQDPVKVEEGILLRADDIGVYLEQDDLQVLASGGSGSVYAAYVVPVNLLVTEFYLERTFSTGD